jgi:CO dehydrogenase/acetyl-CoA synthase beta subunit
MQVFEDIISDIRAFHDQKMAEGVLRVLPYSQNLFWPSAGDQNMVFQSDTAVELGHPALESVVFHLWTENLSLINDGQISLIGPNIAETTVPTLPFGKIVLIGGSGFNDENAHDRYREIGLARFDLSLKGYMMRAASQYLREWSRISRDAIAKGFSLSTLGSALIHKYKKMNYVSAVEIIFITSEQGGFEIIAPLADKAMKINNAMSKMMAEMSFDCEDCEYEEICNEVAAMRNMRKTRQKSGRESRLDA